jgi:transposase
MTTIPKVHVGVDISKNSLDICIFPLRQFLKIENSEIAIKKMLKALAKYEVEQIACEATGGYEKLLTKVLKENGYDLWIVDPRRIKGFIIASGCRTKTDKIDAQKIAEFAAKNSRNYDPIDKTENQIILQSLVNRKNDLTKILAIEKTRLKHPSHALYLSSIKHLIKVLTSEIKAIDLQMRSLIKSDDRLDQKTVILESIPGIGIASAALLISHIPELGKISNRKISALIGVCPYDSESGKYKGKRSIRGGRVAPRNNLYMCALTTIKYNLILKAFYDRLIANKKPFKVAIVAVMHKLIIIANSLLKKGELCKI